MHDSDGPSPLSLDAEQMRALGYRVVDRLVERHAHLRAAPVWGPGDRPALERLLREPPPEHGTDFDLLAARLFDEVLPYGARIDHPRFLAFVPGVPTWPAVLGDFIAAGADIFQGTWLASSGVSTMELVVLDWFRSWLGMPAGSGGLLVSGGSVANLTAIATARHARFGGHDPRATLYFSRETHSSVLRAARVLGFADEQVRAVDVDAHDRMDLAHLERLLREDAGAGRLPFLLIANGGTTSTGAVDALPELAALCRREGLWFHVDAAYGGFAALTERGRRALAGIEHADSVTLDPHKWLYQSFEAGCLLLREPARLRAAFHVLPSYLQDTALAAPAPPEVDLEAPVNFAERGVQLTRAARAVKIWLSLKYFGVGAYRAAIDRCLDLTARAAALIDASAALELLRPASLGIVCFRRTFEDAAPETVDARNAALAARLAESGAALISSTRIDGRFSLRLCILNYRTEWQDVEAVLRFFQDEPSVPRG